MKYAMLGDCTDRQFDTVGNAMYAVLDPERDMSDRALLRELTHALCVLADHVKLDDPLTLMKLGVMKIEESEQ